MMPFHPVKPIRGGKPMDGFFRRLEADPEWMCQAKINGQRAIWHGGKMWSRQGNVLGAKAQPVMSALGSVAAVLDGEFVMTQGKATYYVFDMPDSRLPLGERWPEVAELVRAIDSDYIRLCPCEVRWEDVELNNWEGVVFKRRSSVYVKSMTSDKTTPNWIKYRAEWL